MRNKSFSYSLKAKHDGVGKSIATEIMRDLVGGVLVRENIKEDSGDFTDGFWDQQYQLRSGKRIKVEPEMKDSKWWGKNFSETVPFKYDSMDIPFRKQKNQAHLHMVISTCQQFAFLVTRDAMNKALEESGGSPKIKKTIYEPEGAPYFSTPVEHGTFVEKVDGRWKRCGS